jgi:hypothetical protein
MSNNVKIIEGLKKEGLIGPNLTKVMSRKKGKGATLAYITEAALSSSAEAREKAKTLGVSYVIVENSILYQFNPDGTKVFLKKITQSKVQVNKTFVLK